MFFLVKHLSDGNFQRAPKSSEKSAEPLLEEPSVPSSSAARWNGRCPADVEAVHLETEAKATDSR